jgi:NADH:ubiquinone oxidoreductase subunit H
MIFIICNNIYFFTFSLCFVWFIYCLAETNRTPFQFAEVGSELVSGCNIEYGAGSFALIFFLLAEYTNIPVWTIWRSAAS